MGRLLLLLCLLLALSGARADSEPALPHEVLLNGVEFVLVPEGWFWYTVGTGNIDEQPPGSPLYRSVRVWLDSYYLAKYEARARDYERFLNASPSAPPDPSPADAAHENWALCTVQRRPDGTYYRPRPDLDLPATNLSWALADEFARWMGFRLPTEAEWEKAARGTDRRIWPWGDTYPDDTYAVFGITGQCEPAEVASYPRSESPYGIRHMAGNVAEFVADWYNEAFDASLKDGVRNPPLAPVGSHIPFSKPAKITKGGQWRSNPLETPIADRWLLDANTIRNRYGARFAVDAAVVTSRLAQGTATVIRP